MSSTPSMSSTPQKDTNATNMESSPSEDTADSKINIISGKNLENKFNKAQTITCDSAITSIIKEQAKNVVDGEETKEEKEVKEEKEDENFKLLYKDTLVKYKLLVLKPNKPSTDEESQSFVIQVRETYEGDFKFHKYNYLGDGKIGEDLNKTIELGDSNLDTWITENTSGPTYEELEEKIDFSDTCAFIGGNQGKIVKLTNAVESPDSSNTEAGSPTKEKETAKIIASTSILQAIETRKLQARILELETALNETKEQLTLAVTKMKLASGASTKEMEEVLSAREKQMRDLQARYNELEMQLQQSHDASMKTKEAEWTTKLEALKKEAALTQKNLVEKHKTEMEQLKKTLGSSNKELIQKMNEKHGNKLKKALKEYNQKLEKQKQQQVQEINIFRRQFKQQWFDSMVKGDFYSDMINVFNEGLKLDFEFGYKNLKPKDVIKKLENRKRGRGQDTQKILVQFQLMLNKVKSINGNLKTTSENQLWSELLAFLVIELNNQCFKQRGGGGKSSQAAKMEALMENRSTVYAGDYRERVREQKILMEEAHEKHKKLREDRREEMKNLPFEQYQRGSSPLFQRNSDMEKKQRQESQKRFRRKKGRSTSPSRRRRSASPSRRRRSASVKGNLNRSTLAQTGHRIVSGTNTGKEALRLADDALALSRKIGGRGGSKTHTRKRKRRSKLRDKTLKN